MKTKNVDESSSYLLSAARWNLDVDEFLDDFAADRALPCVALITKGQHLSLGAPNVASPSLKPYVLVHSRRTLRQLVARVYRLKDGRRKPLANGQQLLAIPESYGGYFEILSEDGRPVKCLESVLELCQKFPELCLVRAPCKAYLPDSDGELRNQYHSRTIHEGEVLTLVGQFNHKRTVFLRCFDEMGASVYLKLSQKGKFSAIARPDSITGVHCVANLLTKRLPLSVRQIGAHVGAEPIHKLLGVSASTCLVLQLQSVISDDVVGMYPLQKQVSPETLALVPANTHIRLAAPVNQQQLRRTTAFNELDLRCERLYESALDRICVISEQQYAAVVNTSKSNSQHHKRSTTIDSHNSKSTSGKPTNFDVKQSPVTESTKLESTTAPMIYADEEIDQLYDYVRGLAPMPDGIRDRDRDRDEEDRRNRDDGEGGSSRPRSRHRQRSTSGRREKQSSGRRRKPAAAPPPQQRSAPSADADWQGPTIVEITDDVTEVIIQDEVDVNDEHSKRSQPPSPPTASLSPPTTSTTTTTSPKSRQSTKSRTSSLTKSTDQLNQQHQNSQQRYRRGGQPPPTNRGPGPRQRPYSMAVPDNVNLMPPHPPPPHPSHRFHPSMMIPPMFFGGQPSPSRLYHSQANLSNLSPGGGGDDSDHNSGHGGGGGGGGQFHMPPPPHPPPPYGFQPPPIRPMFARYAAPAYYHQHHYNRAV